MRLALGPGVETEKEVVEGGVKVVDEGGARRGDHFEALRQALDKGYDPLLSGSRATWDCPRILTLGHFEIVVCSSGFK